MMITKVSIKTSSLRGLRPVLNAWVNRTVAYCKCHGSDDNPWWYTERASLSVLAAAAWSIDGWCALEEYSISKQGVIPEDGVDEGGSKAGRCDLWIGNRIGYAFEAKQAWQSIGQRASGADPGLWKAHRLAWNDSARLPADTADKRLAAVFVTPYVPVLEISRLRRAKKPLIDNGALTSCIDSWLRRLDLRNDPRVDAYAWIFPERRTHYVGKDGKNLFPGTLIMLQERKRGRKVGSRKSD